MKFNVNPSGRVRKRLGGVALLSAACIAAALAIGAPLTQVVPRELDLLLLPSSQTSHGERRLLLQASQAGSRIVAVGEGGLILRSEDGGQGWKQVTAPSSVMLTAVTFVDERSGWVVGHDGLILHTADGGQTWQRQFDGRQANEQVLASAQRRLQELRSRPAASEDAQRNLARAQDRLAEAEELTQVGPSRPLLGVAFVDAKVGYAAGSFGQLLATRDGGAHWESIGDRLDNPNGYHLNGIAVASNGDLLVAAEAGTVFRSTDGGRAWKAIELGYAGHIYGVLALPGGAVRIAYGFNGHLFRSEDGGERWAPVRAPVAHTLVHGMVKDGIIWLLAQNGELLRSDDAGRTFTAAGRVPGENVNHFLAVGERLLVAGTQGMTGMNVPVQKVNQ